LGLFRKEIERPVNVDNIGQPGTKPKQELGGTIGELKQREYRRELRQLFVGQLVRERASLRAGDISRVQGIALERAAEL
jgi:hypothetical protein